jgi:hypothetical protein
MFPGPILNSERHLSCRKTIFPQKRSSATKTTTFIVGSAIAAILYLSGGLMSSHIEAENAKHPSAQNKPRDHTSEAFSL